MWLAEASHNHVEIDIVVQDTGVGMSPLKLDSLFRDLEQVQTASEETELDNAVVGSAPSPTDTTGSKGQTLGARSRACGQNCTQHERPAAIEVGGRKGIAFSSFSWDSSCQQVPMLRTRP